MALVVDLVIAKEFNLQKATMRMIFSTGNAGFARYKALLLVKPVL
jgi:hypothetical protein